MKKLRILTLSLIAIASLTTLRAMAAGSNSYTQTNLVSDTPGMAKVTDPNLINPWGVAFIPGNPFWIADNNSGLSTLYDRHGAIQSAPFTIPPPAGSSNLATPTGIVANTNGGFNVNGQSSVFIFDTEDGTISGWNTVGSAAILAVDNSKSGAVYKGLAMITNGSGAFLLATNFRSASVEVYDINFHRATLTGGFTDPTIPTGFAPFGIHVINNQVIVTYAQQDQAMHDPVHAVGAGYVSLFALDGTFVRRIASQGTLNAPWGVTMAPTAFASLGGDLLVGNFGDGIINAFDFNAGTLVDQMKDANGAPITNASLWDMVFDSTGQTGDSGTMYITAGLANEQHGLFAAITANAAPPPPTADFSIGATPMALTIAAGQTATFTVTAGGMNGFNSSVSFSCSGEPAGTSCKFNPATVTPQSGGSATTTVTIGTSSNPYHPMSAMSHAGLWPFAVSLFPSHPVELNASGHLGFASRVQRFLAARISLAVILVATVALLAALLLTSSTGRLNLAHIGKTKRAKRAFLSLAGAISGAIVLIALTGTAGCGGGKANMQPSGTPRGAATIVITGTSGSMTHSVSVALTVQ